MKQKVILLTILGVFMLLTTVGTSVFGNIVSEQKECNVSILDTDNPEMLDQYQNDTSGLPLIVGKFPSEDANMSSYIAQSFVPTKEVLTKIELYICKNDSASYPFIVDIREELTGDNLATVSVSPENINTFDISNETLNLSWVSFNVAETFFSPGQTYYLIGRTENTTDNWYLWAQNNNSESYLPGEAYISYDEGSTWTNHSKAKPKPYVKTLSDDNNQSDMCFKTYGIDATQFEIGFEIFSKNLTTTFNNIGSINATGVFFEVTVTGGVLGLIDETTDGLFIIPITPDGEQTIQTPVFGFGPVDIQASIYASNAKIVTKNVEGFVFLRYIFVFSTLS